MNNNFIYNVKPPTSDTQATNRGYVSNNLLRKSNPSMLGHFNANDGKITHLDTPTLDKDAANKKYVDDKVTFVNNKLVNYVKKMEV